MSASKRKTFKKLLKGSVATAILSEKSLAKEWETKEEDEVWEYLDKRRTGRAK